MKNILVVLLCCSLVGCGDRVWLRSVGSFSTANAPSLEQASSAYTTVGALHTLEEEAVLADHYSSLGYRPGQLTDFIKPDDLRVREEAINVLCDYLTLVGDLSNGKRQQQEIEDETKSLTITAAGVRTATASSTATNTTTNSASNAVKVNPTLTDTTTQTGTITNTVTSSQNTLMTSQQMGMIMSGMDSAIKPFINHMVKSRLLPLMKSADPTIQQLCTLLTSDLVTLRAQAKGDYLVLLMEQNQFIQKNEGKLSPSELREETEKLYQIEQDAAWADHDLAAATEAVQKLAVAHHQLVVEEKHGAK